MGKPEFSPLDALAFQVLIGADEAIVDEAVNHLKAPVAPSKIREVAEPAASAPLLQPVPKTIATPPSAITADLARNARTLAELKEAIAGFEGLDLKLTATNIVFADGNPQAHVMVIGEAPGSEEDRQGKPFVGASGRLLDQMLAGIGLSRAEADSAKAVYISNVLNWRPPGNRKPTPGEVALSLPFLHRHIELIDPRLILLSGDVAAKAVTGRGEGITRSRGKWYDIPVGDKTYKALATFHPAFLLRVPINKRDAWRDMLSLKAALKEIS